MWSLAVDDAEQPAGPRAIAPGRWPVTRLAPGKESLAVAPEAHERPVRRRCRLRCATLTKAASHELCCRL